MIIKSQEALHHTTKRLSDDSGRFAARDHSFGIKIIQKAQRGTKQVPKSFAFFAGSVYEDCTC